MNNITRNDFLFFQNEILRDVKTTDNKTNEKINDLTKELKSNYDTLQQNFNSCQEQLTKIFNSIDFEAEHQKIKEMLYKFQNKVDDLLIIERTKISTMEKQLSNMNFKYDKIYSNNLLVPGIIGISCPYPTMAHFIDYANKKINELLLEKQKQNFEYKSYKDRLENLINSFKDQMKSSYTIINSFCNDKFLENDKNCLKRMSMIEEKISNMRLENGKYSSELMQKSTELSGDIENVRNIKDDIFKKLETELENFKKSNNNLVKIFNSQRDEYTMIKSRFTELSQFIRDVRFRSNINKNSDIQDYDNPNSYYEKKKIFTDMSRRINFNHKQKLDIVENINNDDENNVFTSGDENGNKMLTNRSKISDKDSDSENSINNITHRTYISPSSKKKVKKNKKSRFNPLDKPILVKNIQSSYKNYVNSSKKNVKFNKIIKVNNSYEEKQNSNIITKDIGMNTNLPTQENQNLSVVVDNNKEQPNKNQNILSNVNENKKVENNVKINDNQLDKKKKNNSSLSLNNKQRNQTKALTFLVHHKKNQSKFVDFSEVTTQSLADNKKTVNDNDISDNENIKSKKYFSPDDTKNDFGKNKLQIDTQKSSNISGISRDKNYNNYSNYHIYGKNKLPLYTEKSKIENNKNMKNLKNVLNFNKTTADFGFITNPEIRDKNNAYKNDNSNSFEYYYEELYKKITETNKNINDIYSKLDNKICRILGILMGKILIEDRGNNNIFTFNFSPKNIFTPSDVSLPLATSNKKEKNLYSRNIIYLDKNKYFSPINLKSKSGSYKTFLNKVEPFLIKKFKD